MLNFRKAKAEDVDLYFEWTNDEYVRQNSYHQQKIDYNNHVAWFLDKIKNNSAYMLLFIDQNQTPVGQVRIEPTNETNAVIGISVAAIARGKGYSTEMIKKASDAFLSAKKQYVIEAYVMKHNVASYKSFLKAGYILQSELKAHGIDSYLLTYSHE
jgi:RimJ/RimL family protein N-acetyltransferase